MAKSTDLEVKSAEEIQRAALEAAEADLAAENMGAIDESDIQIPLLKIGQSMTAEVQEGDASPGSFINSLTREDLGREVSFIVSRVQKGRFHHGDRDQGIRARKSYGSKTVPWKDDPLFGRPFTEHPDAEEKYNERVNAGEIQWGKGPKISTTFDFTGYVVPEDEDAPWIPVCLSLMRTNTKQAKKWVTIINAVLRGRAWDSVFELSTERQTQKDSNFYVVNVKQGRKTTVSEKQQAMTLAQALRSAAVSYVGDEAEEHPTVEPDAAGGMEV